MPSRIISINDTRVLHVGFMKIWEGWEKLPLLSGNTAVSPAVKSKVRAMAPPRKTVARAWPLWK